MKKVFKKTTLDKICFITDGSHFSPKEAKDEYLMASVRDFTSYGLDFSGCKRINEDDYQKLYQSGCVPCKGDILIGKDGARCFEDIIVYKQDEKPALLSSIAIIRCKNEMVIPEYLYYYLKVPSVHDDVRENYVSGSAIPRIILKDFKRLPVVLPDIVEQRKIVKVLSCLDRKIQINESANVKMEELAKSLFELYFYSNESLGLKKCTLRDVTTQVTDKLGNREAVVLSAVNKGILQPSDEYFNKQVYSKSIEKYIVVSEWDFAYNPARVNIGSIGINDLGFLGCVSPVYVVFKVNPNYRGFFRFYFRSEQFREECIARASGSVRQTLNYREFSNIEIKYPQESVALKFEEEWKKLKKKIDINIKENEKLRMLRDALMRELIPAE